MIVYITSQNAGERRIGTGSNPFYSSLHNTEFGGVGRGCGGNVALRVCIAPSDSEKRSGKSGAPVFYRFVNAEYRGGDARQRGAPSTLTVYITII